MGDNYVVHSGPGQYTVLQDDEGYCVTREGGESVIVKYEAIQGPPPTPEQIAAAVAEWELAHPTAPATPEQIAEAIAIYVIAHPLSYEWSSPGPVTSVDFDHPLTFRPNVEVIDSAGSRIMVVPTITPGHIHFDLGVLMSVTVLLS